MEEAAKGVNAVSRSNQAVEVAPALLLMKKEIAIRTLAVVVVMVAVDQATITIAK